MGKDPANFFYSGHHSGGNADFPFKAIWIHAGGNKLLLLSFGPLWSANFPHFPGPKR